MRRRGGSVGVLRGSPYFAPTGIERIRASLLNVPTSPIRHSQTRTTRHPSLRRARSTLLSRRLFSQTFLSQKTWRLLGARRQRGHPCQKQPSTNSVTLAAGRIVIVYHPPRGRARISYRGRPDSERPDFRALTKGLSKRAVFGMDRRVRAPRQAFGAGLWQTRGKREAFGVRRRAPRSPP